MTAQSLLQPVFAMAILTLSMWVWMYITRIPSMSRLNIDPQRAQDASVLKELLPSEVSRIANNYNHLFEQPTLFYAVAIAISVLNQVDATHVTCAWAFVVLRVAHSLVQATVDIVMLRFVLFVLSWLVLAVMIVRASFAVF